MKKLIVKWLLGTAGLITVILFILYLFSVGINISEKSENKKTNTADIAVLRAYLSDSIQTSSRGEKKAYRDSVVAVEQKKTLLAKQEAQKHRSRAEYYEKRYGIQKTKADSLVRVYRGDTTATSEKCDEAITALQSANKELEAKNKELDAENFELDAECDGYSNQLYLAREQIKDDSITIASKNNLVIAQGIEIEAYKKAKKKYESGFVKAQKYIFAVAGAVITYLIIK